LSYSIQYNDALPHAASGRRLTITSTRHAHAILRRSDINFAADGNTAMLLLRRSKTDINRTGVRIILAATGDAACPVAALRRLFDTDPKVDPDEPLLSFSGKNTAFTRTRVLEGSTPTKPRNAQVRRAFQSLSNVKLLLEILHSLSVMHGAPDTTVSRM
jgi:hypothetical protein